MRFLRSIKCSLGLHSPGRYCAYCGALLDSRPLRPFMVKSVHCDSLDVVVKAIDEQHAKALAGRGWHPDNLTATQVMQDSARAPELPTG